MATIPPFIQAPALPVPSFDYPTTTPAGPKLVIPPPQMPGVSDIPRLPVPQLPNVTVAPTPRVSIPLPSSAAPSNALPVPQVPGVTTPLAQAEANANALRNSKPGADQVQNPFLRALAKAGDVATSVFGALGPLEHAIVSQIPGTTTHHNYLVNQADRRVATLEAQQQADAATAQTQAITANQTADARKTNDEAYGIEHPAPDPGKLLTDANKNPIGYQRGGQVWAKGDPTMPADGAALLAQAHDTPDADRAKTITTKDGEMQWNSATGKYDILAGQPKPGTPDEQAFSALLAKGMDPAAAYRQMHPPAPGPGGEWTAATVSDGNGGQKSVLLSGRTGTVKDAPAGLTKSTAGGAKLSAD